jgi:hypothetical protein
MTPFSALMVFPDRSARSWVWLHADVAPRMIQVAVIKQRVGIFRSLATAFDLHQDSDPGDNIKR